MSKSLSDNSRSGPLCSLWFFGLLVLSGLPLIAYAGASFPVEPDSLLEMRLQDVGGSSPFGLPQELLYRTAASPDGNVPESFYRHAEQTLTNLILVNYARAYGWTNVSFTIPVSCQHTEIDRRPSTTGIEHYLNCLGEYTYYLAPYWYTPIATSSYQLWHYAPCPLGTQWVGPNFTDCAPILPDLQKEKDNGPELGSKKWTPST